MSAPSLGAIAIRRMVDRPQRFHASCGRSGHRASLGRRNRSGASCGRVADVQQCSPFGLCLAHANDGWLCVGIAARHSVYLRRRLRIRSSRGGFSIPAPCIRALPVRGGGAGVHFVISAPSDAGIELTALGRNHHLDPPDLEDLAVKHGMGDWHARGNQYAVQWHDCYGLWPPTACWPSFLAQG